jgi:hypothetical protein
MAQTQVTLTEPEREYLANLLQKTLKTTLVEEHRTRAPTYREQVIRQEQLIQELLHKLDAGAS